MIDVLIDFGLFMICAAGYIGMMNCLDRRERYLFFNRIRKIKNASKRKTN